MAEKPQPVRVLYCAVCSLPAEYCEFGPDFEKCKPWLIQNAPGLYPDLTEDSNSKEEDKVTRQLQSTSISASASSVFFMFCLFTSDHYLKIFWNDDIFSPSSSLGCWTTTATKQEEVKRLPGGKIKKKEKQEVIIEKVVRNKRKCITTVKGLELFGVKLSDASKKLGKKFATGASVVKGPTEKDQIDVQGDISYDIVEFITETWHDVTYFYHCSFTYLELLPYVDAVEMRKLSLHGC
ncbi:hypothetical protein JRO89_XSUnG0052500 [Xanthoceras sorbifolium]|uniref:Translation machinery-associated protein 22 n=1 Tax=Xanthoceras sorbifolium TaxID=99658 RepID=A0ABQ8GZW5_9ROSI|nr:hypothetical protein JRO89_XSUnG0052500 [Xanthoceras sorbifolium]